MKKQVMLASAVASMVIILANWTTQETTTTGDKKHRVNFYGILETHEGNAYNVENISINMKYKQIYFYEAPSEFPKDLMLLKDPRKGFIAKIDLAEVSEIQVPQPNLKLAFKKGSTKKEYLEVKITFSDTGKTTRTYLIDHQTKVECDEQTSAGPIEMESLSFAALKRLTIKGYSYREAQHEQDSNMEKTSQEKKLDIQSQK